VGGGGVARSKQVNLKFLHKGQPTSSAHPPHAPKEQAQEAGNCPNVVDRMGRINSCSHRLPRRAQINALLKRDLAHQPTKLWWNNSIHAGRRLSTAAAARVHHPAQGRYDVAVWNHTGKSSQGCWNRVAQIPLRAPAGAHGEPRSDPSPSLWHRFNHPSRDGA
jgi:hypothetical protein